MKFNYTKLSILLVPFFLFASMTNIAADNGKQIWESRATEAARNAPYLSVTEKQTVTMVNRARVDPSIFAETYLGERAKKDAKIRQLYRQMKKIQPMEALSSSKPLYLAAKEYVRDMYTKDMSQISKRSESSRWGRIEKYGEWKDHVAESISSGHHDPLGIVVQLLLQTESPDQCNILDPRSRFIGVGIGTHKKYRYICVMNFAASINSKAR